MTSFEQIHEPDAYQSRYDPESMPASMAVIATLSEVTGQCPTDLRPLHEAVDTDALDEVFRKTRGSHDDISVTFSLMGHTITVNAPDRITITSNENGATIPNVASNGNEATVPNEEDAYQ